MKPYIFEQVLLGQKQQFPCKKRKADQAGMRKDGCAREQQRIQWGKKMLTCYVSTYVKIEQISKFHQYSKHKLHPGKSGNKLNRTS